MDSLAPELDPVDYLSARQKQALICAAAGLTNREIAERLFVSTRSIDRDLKEACVTLQAQTRTAAVLQAYRQGVIRDEHLEPSGN